MTEIRLLAVPYEVGALRVGVGRGPERLLEVGAEEALASRGARVSLRGGRGSGRARGLELIGLVSAGVRRAIDDGAFPVLLSGSCFAGIGVVTGIG